MRGALMCAITMPAPQTNARPLDTLPHFGAWTAAGQKVENVNH
jgi:hypothetical protein